MSIDNEKNLNISESEQGCGCGCGHDHGHEHECGCGHDHGHEHECGCGQDHENECGCGCGCGHEHGQRYVTLVMDDDTEVECPIIDIFEIEEKSYIALFHPVEESVLLLRLYVHEDNTIDVGEILDDEEFELVAKTFSAMHEE